MWNFVHICPNNKILLRVFLGYLQFSTNEKASSTNPTDSFTLKAHPYKPKHGEINRTHIKNTRTLQMLQSEMKNEKK